MYIVKIMFPSFKVEQYRHHFVHFYVHVRVIGNYMISNIFLACLVKVCF